MTGSFSSSLFRASSAARSGSIALRETQHGFLFIQERCTGCKTCEIACKGFHHLGGNTALRTIHEHVEGAWTQDAEGAWNHNVHCYYLSLSCNHCTNPICMRFCARDAIAKDARGFVTVNAKRCVGCQSCMTMCPYHAPRFDIESGKVTKCDGCSTRLAEGKQPICVEACPQRALYAGPITKLRSIRAMERTVSSLPPLPSPDITQPNLFIQPGGAAFDERGFPGSA